MALAVEVLQPFNSSVYLADVITPLRTRDIPIKESPLPIRASPNSINLDLNPEQLDDENRLSRAYEESCFRAVVDDLEPGEVAYGANLLDRSFGQIAAQFTSIPDVLVGKIIPSYSSIGNRWGSALEITKLIEARTGRIRGTLKLAGFRNLIDGIRQNPYRYARSINELLGDQGGILNPTFFISPPINQVEVVFYCPRLQYESGEESRQNNIDARPFKGVRYETVPLPFTQVKV
jgi:hypothetical protein